MKKQKKQNLLSMLIALLVIVLIMLVGSIVYEETINIMSSTDKEVEQVEKNDSTKENEEVPAEKEQEDEITIESNPETDSKVDKEEFVGEEENSVENTTKSDDEKAIDLVKKEWGDDESVLFNIVDKSGSKYRISVTSQATVLQWYEVDTETWEVSEF